MEPENGPAAVGAWSGPSLVLSSIKECKQNQEPTNRLWLNLHLSPSPRPYPSVTEPSGVIWIAETAPTKADSAPAIFPRARRSPAIGHRASGIEHRASSEHWRIGASPQIEGYYPWRGRGPTRAIASCGTSGPRTTNNQHPTPNNQLPLQPPRWPVRARQKVRK